MEKFYYLYFYIILCFLTKWLKVFFHDMRQSGILQAIYLQPTYESLRLQNRIVLAYGSNQPMLQPPNAAIMQLRGLQIILFVQVGPTLYCIVTMRSHYPNGLLHYSALSLPQPTPFVKVLLALTFCLPKPSDSLR